MMMMMKDTIYGNRLPRGRRVKKVGNHSFKEAPHRLLLLARAMFVDDL